MINITSNDILLAKQKNRRHYAKIQILNREWKAIGTVMGRFISGTVNIDGESEVRRTASLTVEAETASLDIRTELSVNYYIKLYCGIENNASSEVIWYSQGVFIISSSGFSFDPKTRMLSLSLSDLMTDLNGERAGELHAYTSIVKNSEKIDETVKNVLELCGFESYDVCSMGVLRETTTFFDEKASEDDELIPYDLEFPVGVTGYDIISKCVNLYPYYEMGFDVNGTFVVRRKPFEEDDSFVILDAYTMGELVISEDTDINWSAVRNYIGVWGKDGNYYGEAHDDNPGSPFQVASSQVLRLTVKGNQYGVDTNSICDRYADTELENELLKEQAGYEADIADIEAKKEQTADDRTELARLKNELSDVKQRRKQNVSVKGDDLAKQWAQKLLYEYSRLNDGITLKTVMLPFINDTNFKISYRSKTDGIVKTYVVKGVSHDITGGTTTINAVRFYNDQCSAYWDKLDAPEFITLDVSGMTVSVVVTSVRFAQKYTLLIDYKPVAVSTGTALSYTLPEEYEGEHVISVRASADNFRPAGDENARTVEFSAADTLVTENREHIITESGERIVLG